jgi:hypothetical protein
MDASSLLRQIERFKTQLHDEKDVATQREMRRTISHLYKQYRKATTQRTPWYGFRLNVLYLVAFFLILIGVLAMMVRSLGFWSTFGVCFLTILVLVILTSMVFLLMRIFSPAQYQKIVGTALTAFQNTWRHSTPKRVEEIKASQDEEVGD